MRKLKKKTSLNVIGVYLPFYCIKPSECQRALGMKNGAIPDGQISASSHWNANHAAIQGRLDYEGTRLKAGSWSSRYNNNNQWLQIDLYSEYTKVTRIATQGRNRHSQWVKLYKLQYSKDGKYFLFYKEPGKSADKVN